MVQLHDLGADVRLQGAIIVRQVGEAVLLPGTPRPQRRHQRPARAAERAHTGHGPIRSRVYADPAPPGPFCRLLAPPPHSLTRYTNAATPRRGGTRTRSADTCPRAPPPAASPRPRGLQGARDPPRRRGHAGRGGPFALGAVTRLRCATRPRRLTCALPGTTWWALPADHTSEIEWPRRPPGVHTRAPPAAPQGHRRPPRAPPPAPAAPTRSHAGGRAAPGSALQSQPARGSQGRRERGYKGPAPGVRGNGGPHLSALGVRPKGRPRSTYPHGGRWYGPQSRPSGARGEGPGRLFHAPGEGGSSVSRRGAP